MSSAWGYLAEAGWKAPTTVQPLTVTVGEEDMAGACFGLDKRSRAERGWV
jgi:hypothetical protein